jgi:hypothetical protein
MWEFRHGTETIHCRIEDDEWIEKFQKRQIDVRPGDSLRVNIESRIAYDKNKSLLSEKKTVKKVLEVIVSESVQQEKITIAANT